MKYQLIGVNRGCQHQSENKIHTHTHKKKTGNKWKLNNENGQMRAGSHTRNKHVQDQETSGHFRLTIVHLFFIFFYFFFCVEIPPFSLHFIVTIVPLADQILIK